MLIIIMMLLVLGIIASIIRLIIGPTIWDRLLSINLISIKTILILTVYGVHQENLFLLDIAFSYGIIGFLTVTLLTKFILMGGRQR